MIVFLLGKVSKRKLRLTACAFCRRLWHMLADQRSRDALETAEQYADNLVGETELSTAHLGAIAATEEASPDWAVAIPAGAIRHATAPYESVPYDVLHSAESVRYATRDPAGDFGDAESAYQGLLLRDIFGNLFRPVSINPVWLTSQVVSLASVAYEDRNLPSGELDTARLGVVADGLEDAGCDNADILGHLRSPGPHVRGCWVLDLLLG
jgi:hypothetical protein